jgi:hypothetical protein
MQITGATLAARYGARSACPIEARLDRPEGDLLPRWEYITTPLLLHRETAILNNWGSEGWELVQIVIGPEGGLVAFFKRPVASE